MLPEAKTRYGIFCAITAQICWGFFPLYVYLLRSVDSVELVAHRAIWSFVLLVFLLLLSRTSQRPSLPKFSDVAETLGDGRAIVTLLFAASLIAINWLGFVWAVQHDHALDASLGYYICPQIVVLLGVLFQKERLITAQWIALALTAFGVSYMAKSTTGIPWIAFVVAISFGTYALVKKRVAQSALVGLTFETGFLFIPAVFFLTYHSGQVDAAATTNWWTYALLAGTGLATVTPLALYSSAVKHLPLSMVGLLQFLGPTLQFLVGVFAFGEPVDQSRLIGFALVWAGIVLFLAALRTTSPEDLTERLAPDDH